MAGMTQKELVEIIKENFTNDFGDIYICDLDFGDFKGNIFIDRIYVDGDIHQSGHTNTGEINQNQHKNVGDIWQNEHSNYGDVHQEHHENDGDIFQHGHDDQGQTEV